MSIADALYDVAVRDVWANPHQDRHATMQAVRLSRPGGNIGKVTLPFGSFSLPVSGKAYNVFQISHFNISKFGLTKKLAGWTPLSEIVNEEDNFIVAMSGGQLTGMDTTFLAVHSRTNAVLLAVERLANPQSSKLDNPMFIRFYSNAIMSTNTNPYPVTPYTRHHVYGMDTASSLAVLRDEISDYENIHGIPPLIYINGYIYPDGIPALGVEIADSIDVVFDTMMITRHSQKLSTLDTFTSTLDSTSKVIYSKIAGEDDFTVSNPTGTGADVNGRNHVYVDDLEFFIIGTLSNGTRTGCYFPRLWKKDIRQLTPADWSINAVRLDDTVDELVANHPSGLALTDINVMIYERDTRLQDITLGDGNRISDLVNLPQSVRKQALSGINSNMPIWTADALESCALNTWMGAEYHEVNPSLLPGTFSRAGARVSLERPLWNEVEQSWMTPRIADGRPSKMVYFNAGLRPYPMVGALDVADTEPNQHMNDNGTALYLPRVYGGGASSTELLAGSSSPFPVRSRFGIKIHSNDNGLLRLCVPGVDYSISHYNDVYDEIIWDNTDTLARDRYIHYADYSYTWVDNFSEVQLKSGIDVYHGAHVDTDNIGLGNLYVWRNGKYLIEGLDYTLKDSLVYIVNIRPEGVTDENDPSENQIEVIYAGLPNDSLKHEPKGQWGWVKNGLISHDDRYSLYANRNQWFFVDGRNYRLEELSGAEDLLDIGRINPSIPIADGAPYAIVPMPEVLNPTTITDLVASSADEAVIDAVLESYIDGLYPEPEVTAPVVITSRYDVVSLTMEVIIEDIRSGVLPIDSVSYSDSAMAIKCSPYSELLEMDACNLGGQGDFLEIHPRRVQTPLVVTLAQYNFLDRVNTLFLNGRVSGLGLYLNIVN